MAASRAVPLPKNWHRDRDTFLKVWNDSGCVAREVQRRTGLTFSTIIKWRDRHLADEQAPPPHVKHVTKGKSGVLTERPGAKINARAGTGVIVTDPRQPEDLGDLVGLLERRGLNADEWEVSHVGVNEWEGNGGRDANGDVTIITLRQLKAQLRRKVDLDWLFPANLDRPVFKFGKPSKPGKGFLLAALSDQQAGYHEPLLHQAVCRWLRDVQPEEIAFPGDTLDFPTISRHMDKPRWSASAQECINAGYVVLHDYCEAAPDARKRKLRGNHDWRLESELLTRAERLFELRPADLDGADHEDPVWSIKRLLRLDYLGIDLVGHLGDDWKQAEIVVTPDLVVRHQAPNMTNALRLGRSIIAGDSHKQNAAAFTEWTTDDQPTTRWIVQTGTLAQSRNGLGYAKDPNWQQGFATCEISKDGGLQFDLATWDGKTLRWRGECW